MTTFYDDISVHRRMVADSVRTEAFRASIAATVQPGDVVADVGAGSGILSLFAAQAGAARVYGIERAPAAAALARRIVAANRLEDRIVIIHGDAETARLPEPVDVIVSEWCGVLGVDENMLAPLLAARDRWLKPGGKLIPGPVTAWMAPAWSDAGAAAVMFWNRLYELDLTALAGFSFDEVVWLSNKVADVELRAEPKRLWVTDPATLPAAYASQPFTAQSSFSLRGAVNGLIAWFSAEMPGAAELTNRPGAPATHWGQFLFPVASAVSSEPGEVMSVDFRCLPSPLGGSNYVWSAQVGSGHVELHDTRRLVRPATSPPWRAYVPGGFADAV